MTVYGHALAFTAGLGLAADGVHGAAVWVLGLGATIIVLEAVESAARSVWEVQQ